MTITTRPTSAGRVMIESDGCSAYYGGALVQGEPIARVSAPAALAARFTLRDTGEVDLRALLDEARFERSCGRDSGVRILSYSVVR